MAREIDEKIVQMRFENENFEAGARQTIKTLDDLNHSTDSLGTNTAGMEELIRAIDKVNSHFGLMETVARGALERIGSSAVDAGMKLAKNMTVDQVASGWEKYGEKTRAMKTIMNATGESIDTVNGYLEKLMWYTDETSYNFVDMTSNIGKFTSAGVDLNTATDSMIGIANWAALAGQGANEASRAMYNLSQALGRGYVQWQDWMSVVNANMDTKEIKEQFIETAKALGELSEAGLDAKGNLVTFGNFGETLKEGWLTTDVLNATLAKYSDFTNEIYKMTQETGMSASEAIEALGASYESLGKKAFLAGQVSKTFADALDATADAASSRWMTIFEKMFGNLEQQEKFWTDVTSYMYDAFVGGLDSVVDALAEWESMDGSLYFLYALDTAMNSVVGIIQIFGNAWEKAFGPLTGDFFMGLTRGLIGFAEALAPTEETLDDLSSVLGAFLSVIGTAGKYVIAFAKGFEPLVSALNYVLGTILNFLGFGGDIVTLLSQWVASEEALNLVTNTTRTIVQGLVDTLGVLLKLIGAVGYSFFDAFSQLSFSWDTGITGLDKFVETLKNDLSQIMELAGFGGFDLEGTFGQISTFFSNLATQLGGPFKEIADYLSSFFENLRNLGQNGSIDWSSMSLGQKAVTALGVAFEETGKFLDGSVKGLESFATWLREIMGPFGTGVREFLDYFISRLGELSTGDIFDILLAINVGNIIKPMNDISEAFGEMMGSISDTLETYQSKIKVDAFYKLAKAIAILAASLLLVSKVPVGQLAGSAAVLVGLGAGLTGFMFAIDKITDSWDDDKVERFGNITKAMLPLVVSINLLSMACKTLAGLDVSGMASGVVAIGALLMELAAFVKLVDGLTIDKKSISSLTALSLAIKLLVKPIEQLGALDLKTLAKGLGSVGVAMLELSAFARIVSSGGSGNVANAAVGMIPLVGALALMIPVVKKFAEIDWNTLGPGLLKFGSALAVLVAAMVGLSFAGTQALAASVGLLALGAAFALLMPQMAIVAMFEWESIGKILAVFVGVLGAFTVAGLALSAVGPIFVGVAAAVAAFNLSIAAIIAALASLVKALPLAVAAFVAFSTLSSDTVQNGVENIGLFLEGLVDVIIGLKVKVKTAFLQYLSAMLEAIAEMTPDIVNGALLIVTEFLAVLDERLPEILVLLDNILTDIEPYAEKFGKHGAKIAGGFVKGLLEGLWDLLGDVVLSIGEWLDAAIMGGAGKARKQSLANVYAQQGREVSAQVAKNAHENAKTFEASVKQNQSIYKESGWLEANAYLVGSDKRMGRHSPPREIIQRVKENAETFFKESISGHNLTKFGQSGSKQADEYVKQLDTKLESDVPASASKASDSFVSTTKKEAPGTKAAQEVAKEVKEDDSIEKEAAEKAKKVAEAFQAEFEKIDLNLSNVGSKFGIMEAYLGPDAKEKQLQEMQLKQLQEELELYGEKYNAAWQKYQNIQNIPNVKQVEVDKAYNEYLKVYEETAKKAAEIADLQKQMYGSYEEAEKSVFAELVDLGKARQTLISSAQTETSEATKEAYEKFATAATEEQRQYYYNLWNQMKEIDAAGIFGDILAKPIDPSEVRAEVYKQLGLDPNNPMQGFMSVTDLVNQAVQVGRTAYMTAIQENAPQVVEGYQVELANSADEIVDFVENEVAPKYRQVGEMMGEETADGIEISASRVSYSGKKMSTDAVGEVKSTTGEWKDVGVGMMQGIIDGIREMRSEVINAAVEVAQAALQAAKTVLGIASPSKAFMAVGLWAIEGLRNGILDEKGRSEDASAEVANGVVDQFGDIGYRLSRVMDESLHPVIYPSLDLTGVKRAAKNLDSIWSDRTLQTISDLSMSELDRRDELINLRRPVAPVTNNNNNFVQNNYSPKSLSDAEIYLQTKKELDWAFKGARR